MLNACEYTHIIYNEAKRACSRYPREELGDLVGIGAIGLIRGIELFDESKGTPIGAWLTLKVRWHIAHELGRKNILAKAEPLEDGCNDMPVTEVHTDVLFWDWVKSVVTKKAYALLVACYKEGLSQREYADRVNVTESNVSRIHRIALRMLRAAIKEGKA